MSGVGCSRRAFWQLALGIWLLGFAAAPRADVATDNGFFLYLCAYDHCSAFTAWFLRPVIYPAEALPWPLLALNTEGSAFLRYILLAS